MKSHIISKYKIIFPFVFIYAINITKFFNKIGYFKTYLNNEINNLFYFKRYGISSYELRRYFKYINYCMKGILLYKNNLVKSKYPKVSVIITMYNRENFINFSLKSVQNQIIKNLEIIIVDDCSIDNSIKYVKNSQKLDSRIYLLTNQKNMGPLYSKSLGILHAKGQYILILDSDDMLCIDDYLRFLYIEVKLGNYDYVESNKYIFIKNKKIEERKSDEMCFCIKLIKSLIFKKIINRIGKEILNRGIKPLDDNFFFLFLKNYLSKKLKKNGVFIFRYSENGIWQKKFSNKKNKHQFCLGVINSVDSLYDVADNNTVSKMFCFERLFSNIIQTKCYKEPNINKKMIKQLFNKFLYSPYIIISKKKYIKKILSNIYYF